MQVCMYVKLCVYISKYNTQQQCGRFGNVANQNQFSKYRANHKLVMNEIQ